MKILDMEYTYKYPRSAVTAEPKVLLIERGGEPFKGLHDHDEEGWE